MKNRSLLKILSLIFALLLALPVFVSCASEAKAPKDKTVIGEVAGKEVYYDQLYFLVSSYIDSVRNSCGTDEDKTRAELDRLVRENIVSDYAILALCEDAGLEYNEKKMKDEIDEEIDAHVTQSFDGNEDAYYESMKKYGLSERYVRFSVGLDLVYGQLPTVYAQNGRLSSDEATVIKYIKDNFIHVNHLVIFNDDGDDTVKNYEKISEGAQKLRAGEATIGSLIGKSYSEDFSDPDGSGFYISKGTMVKEYEDAAFSLEIDEVSDVVEAMGENNFGEYVSCYYVIQRLGMDDGYINSHYYELRDEYYSSVINAELDAKRSSLTFVPNDTYGELDLLALNTPKKSSPTLAIVLSVVSAIVLIGATVAVVLLKLHHKKKNIGRK